MKRLNVFAILIFVVGALFFSCSKNNRLEEYEAIKLLGIQNSRLHQAVNEYDIKNPDFFESKVDLVSIFVLSNDFEKAFEYLRRAEVLEPKSVSREYLCNYYGLKASILLKNKNYEESLGCCRKATAMKKTGEKFSFLEGQILFAMGNKEDSLKAFKKGFSEANDSASAEDKKIYAMLLAEKGEYEDSVVLLESLFEDGEYFYGLGQLASTVYEKKGMLFESILYAYIDYEYASCFFQIDEQQFLKNLQLVKVKYDGKPEEKEVKKASELIESSLKNNFKFSELLESDSSICRYVKIKNKILSKNNETDNLESILLLKKSFEKFPSYHYLVAESVKNQNVDLIPTECFETILGISSRNKYSDYARIEIGKNLGLDEEESKKILVFSEVKRIVEKATLANVNDAMGSICNLFSLPDNKYVFFAEEYLKGKLQDETILNVLFDKYSSATGKVRERLDYVLNQ